MNERGGDANGRGAVAEKTKDEARERWIEKNAVLFDLILQSVNKEMFEHIKDLVEADDSGRSRGRGGWRGRGRGRSFGRGRGRGDYNEGHGSSSGRGSTRMEGTCWYCKKVVMHPLTHWVIDSGCTSHMTPRADLLDEVKPPGKIKYVAAASGALLPVIGVGNAKVKGANGELVGLGNVLLVEGLSANLLSVRRLQKSKTERECGHKVKVIRSDNGGEFIGADFEGELKRKGIQHQLTVPYNPQQNGVAERAFGCMVVFHVPKEKRGKLEASGRWGVHLGIAKDHKGWLLWDLTTQKLTVSRDVKFLESLYYKEWKQQQQKLPSTPLIVEADEVQRPSRQVEVAVAEQMLEMQFKCSKMGEVKYYLGMHVERDVGKVGLEYSGVRQQLQRGAADVKSGEMLLSCYTDASFNLVKADGTSIGGYVCLLGGGAESWRSKKQNELEIVKTHQQAADIFTKRLAEADHWKGMKLAGMSVH
ncbi:hypothetical protein CLOM_g3316 [Closterium sp. NIES-68]|nr:hypothetical protein CLOM_g3316 [Closterium sp. NIES-68]